MTQRTNEATQPNAQPETTTPHRPRWAPAPPRQLVAPRRAFAAGLRHHHLANTAYPIAHRQTIWSYRQQRERYREILREAFSATARLGLYAHYPFCEKRCRFCEYTVVRDHDDASEARYCDALLSELKAYRALLGPKEIVGLDLGGGTPALVSPPRLEAFVEQVCRLFDLGEHFSISIETTPPLAARDPARMGALRSIGIDRISMGLQTTDPQLLQHYGRRSAVKDNGHAVRNIRAAGFERLNIDLMYGFAGQSRSSFAHTLRHAVALEPEYITLYRMRYKGTRVHQEAADVTLEQVIGLYDTAREVLLAEGYHANPGKNGFSRVSGDPGTSAYLTERVVASTPYLGLGLGAQTFTNSVLAYNLGAASKRADAYQAAVTRSELPLQDLYLLPRREAMAKMLSVSFYFGEINCSAFERCFGVTLAESFPEEREFVLRQGLMTQQGDHLQLTSRGARKINGVIALFYSDRVKQYLLGLGN